MKKLKLEYVGVKIGGTFGGVEISKNVEDLKKSDIKLIEENGGASLIAELFENTEGVVDTEVLTEPKAKKVK